MNPEQEKGNLLDLFTDGNLRPIASITGIAWAENLSFDILSGDFPQSKSKTKILIEPDDIQPRFRQWLQIEILVSYSADALLPVRIEREIRRN